MANRSFGRLSRHSNTPAPITWWRQARFGMFIHWGLYAVPAGKWKGQRVPGISEWIMKFGRIPIPDYEKLAPRFNPHQFDADAWASLAARAGMKYLVITAKHHDGFAMYDSPCSPYNIVVATPFARDPMKDLAAACRRHRIRLCFYYSQTQDWHHPGGAGHWELEPDPFRHREPPPIFQQYLDEKVKPQLRELLTQYGPIGLIWFDTPRNITRDQSLDLKRFVQSIQPKCLVCGRIGNNIGDYSCLGDNMIPVGRLQGDWETPATLNDTWGYKSYDGNWKSTGKLLLLLVDLASKGVNYLLNVGPDARGVIPQASIRRLEQIGAWLAVNGEAIYGSSASPYPYEMPWGRITGNSRRLYLHIIDWPGRSLTLAGLRTPVRRARLLARPDVKVGLLQEYDESRDQHLLTLTLPARPVDRHVSVIRLDLAGDVDVDETPMPQLGGGIVMPAILADIRPASTVQRAMNGTTTGWLTTRPRLHWRFQHEAATYRVEVVTAVPPGGEFPTGHRLSIRIGRQEVHGPLKPNRPNGQARSQYRPEMVSEMGTVTFPRAGAKRLTCQVTRLTTSPLGLGLCEIRLTRVGSDE